jgi:hypothetical protein
MTDIAYLTARFLGCSRRRLMRELELNSRVWAGRLPTGQWWARADGTPLFTKLRRTRYFDTEREALKAARRALK